MRFFSFDIQAKTYKNQAIAQKLFIQKLASKLLKKLYPSIAELGCGGGELFLELEERGVEFERYLACDSSRAMLEGFPLSPRVKLFCQDFDEFLLGGEERFSLICSSSALQWSSNLSHTLSLVAKRGESVALSVLSSCSLASLHRFLGTSSPLLESEEIIELFREYFVGEIFISRVALDFTSAKECLEHLKRSGVLGGGVLGFSKAKELLEFNERIEYESVNIIGKPR